MPQFFHEQWLISTAEDRMAVDPTAPNRIVLAT